MFVDILLGTGPYAQFQTIASYAVVPTVDVALARHDLPTDLD